MIQELKELAKDIQQLVVELKICKEPVNSMQYDLVEENYAKKLGSIRENVESAVRKLSRHTRTAATHIFVFMISAETRKKTPYALPIQCLPIAALKDYQCRELANRIIAAMVERNMKVAGEYSIVKSLTKV